MAGLKVRAGGRYIDATVGDGGHTAEILKKGGIVLGLDRDEMAIERTRQRFETEIEKGKLTLMKSNFDKLNEIVASFAPVSSLAKFARSPSPIAIAPGKPLAALGVASDGSSLTRKFANFANFGGAKPTDKGFDGILFDLGMSSGQIEESGRGFSFQKDEPLDMRMDPELAVTAADLVNGLGKKELFELFVKLGQVERAKAVAEAIVRGRREKPIKTTAELAGLVEKVLPRKGRLHPATKVFMALRMAVNDELGSLERALPQATELLASEGRLAVISFHEGEDRIVKRFFRENCQLEEINRKPIQAGADEVNVNPRARSAKLRIAEGAPNQSYFASWSTSTPAKSDGTGFGRNS